MKHHVVKAKPAPKPRVFGDQCFDFIKGCKHDFQRDNNCPLCKLVVQSSRKYFEDETKRIKQAKEQSLLNRAQMRLGLLTNWARCQYSFYHDFDSSPKLDIVISKTLAEMMIKQSEDTIKLDFDEIVKILNRKNRVAEVGQLAALYIQCRVRRYLTQRYVRRLLLKRFEYVPATKWKDEFYVDSYKAHKWHHYPHLLHKERPASPRTVDRRLNSDNKKREARYQRFQIAWNRANSEQIFRTEQLIVRLLRQFVIFRDVVAVAMHQLLHSIPAAQRIANGYDTTQLYIPVWVAMSPPTSSARQVGIGMALEALPPVGSAASERKNNNSNNREVEQLAMDDGSIDAVGGGAASADGSSGPPTTAAGSPSKGAAAVGGSGGGGGSLGVNYNRALQLLEAKAWDCLRCTTPEEVLSRLVCDDIVPSVDSVLNIAQDDHVIFRGELDFVPPPPSTASSTPSAASAAMHFGFHHQQHQQQNQGIGGLNVQIPSHSASQTTLTRSGAKYQSELLPMCMQLRPCTPDKRPSGLFRLFFYEEEFIAASQVSPWVFYPEVLKHRDVILSTLKSYATSAPVKGLVKQYLQRVNIEYEKHRPATAAATAPGTPGSASGGSRRTSTNPNAKTPGGGGGDRRMSSVSKTKVAAVTAVAHHKNTPFASHHAHTCSSLFTPPQELVFDEKVSDSLQQGQEQQEEEQEEEEYFSTIDLTDEKIVEIAGKYKFLKGLPMFQKRLRQATNAIKKKNAKKPNPAAGTETTAAVVLLNADGSIATEGEATTATANTAESSAIVGLPDPLSVPEEKKVSDNAKEDEEEDTNDNSTVESAKLLPYLPDVHHTATPLADEQMRAMRQMQSHLLGEEIYHLLLGETTSDKKNDHTTSGKKGGVKRGSYLDDDDDSEEEESAVDPDEVPLSKYAEKLLAYSTQVSTDIASRINVPRDVELPNYHYQLMVIDVYITIPKPEKVGGRRQSNFMAGISSTTTPTARGVSDNASVSSDTTGGGASSKRAAGGAAAAAAVADFPIEMHQVTGMFPCHNDKSPPNLECGLFDWNYFHQMYLDRNGMHQTDVHKLGSGTNKKMSAMSLASTASGLSVATAASKERLWTGTNQVTGVCAHKTMLPTLREFQFLMLGAAPSREHLDNELPKNIKKWLGMPITKK